MDKVTKLDTSYRQSLIGAYVSSRSSYYHYRAAYRSNLAVYYDRLIDISLSSLPPRKRPFPIVYLFMELTVACSAPAVI